eukprot:m.524890 g.524890  ORF g.524890 m.524890 type:complete len:64 (-) comp163495_c0_seq1:31-222(-)
MACVSVRENGTLVHLTCVCLLVLELVLVLVLVQGCKEAGVPGASQLRALLVVQVGSGGFRWLH